MESKKYSSFEEEKNNPQKEENGSKRDQSNKKAGFNFGRLFFGFIIVLLGLFYLAKNTEYLPLDLDINIFQLWPLLIIMLGLSLLSGRGLTSNLIGILTFCIASIMVAILLFNGGNSSIVEWKNISVEIERGEEISSATIHIIAGVSDINIKGGAEKLIEGNFQTNLMELQKSSKVENEIQKVKIEIQKDDDWYKSLNSEGSKMDINLNSRVPMDLYFETGAVKAKINLSNVLVRTVDIKTGISSLDLVLGDNMEKTDVKLEAGVSEIKISLPKTVGARIKIDSGISSRELNGFEKTGEKEYQTSNYDIADKKIEMDLDIGITDLKIDRF